MNLLKKISHLFLVLLVFFVTSPSYQHSSKNYRIIASEEKVSSSSSCFSLIYGFFKGVANKKVKKRILRTYNYRTFVKSMLSIDSETFSMALGSVLDSKFVQILRLSLEEQTYLLVGLREILQETDQTIRRQKLYQFLQEIMKKKFEQVRADAKAAPFLSFKKWHNNIRARELRSLIRQAERGNSRIGRFIDITLETGKTIATMYYYPFLVSWRLNKRTILSRKGYGFRAIYKLPYELMNEDALLIAGWASMAVMQGTIIYYLYFDILHHKFIEMAEKEGGEIPEGNIVIASGVKSDDPWSKVVQAHFLAKHGRDPKAIFIQVESAQDLKQKLLGIRKTNGPIAKLEITAHGFPGMIEIGSTSLTETDTSLLRLDDVFVAKAIIQLDSCLAAGDFLSIPVGSSFMQSLGENMLDKGGKVIASTRLIKMDQEDVDKHVVRKDPTIAAYMGGIGLMMMSNQIMTPVIPYLASNDDLIRKVEIPPRSP